MAATRVGPVALASEAVSAIAVAAPAIATTSVSSEIQTQSPGYQPKRRIQRRRSDASRPGHARAAGGRTRGSSAGRCSRRAPQRGHVSSAAAIAVSRCGRPGAGHQASGAGSIDRLLGRRLAPRARRAAVRAEMRAAEQRARRTRSGAHVRWTCRSSSISARRASIPITAAACSDEQIVAEPAAPVHLDQQAAEVVQRLLARLQQRAALTAQHAGLGAARSDPFGVVSPAGERVRPCQASVTSGSARIRR